MRAETELRELDAWIAEHVMAWKLADRKVIGWGDGPVVWLTGDESEDGSPTRQDFRPSTQSADAMEVLKRCTDRLDCEDIKIGFCTGNWSIETVYRENPGGGGGRIRIWALPPEERSLELSICLFARELFSK